jgi:hypothetical protein
MSRPFVTTNPNGVEVKLHVPDEAEACCVIPGNRHDDSPRWQFYKVQLGDRLRIR